MNRRRFLRMSTVAGGFALGLGLYTWQWEPHWVEFVERPLRVALLPDGLSANRLVQVSDLHIGRQVDDSYLIQTFERIKALAPEIVVYTGDFISYQGDHLAHLRNVFAHLPLGRYATLGILGNHDYGPHWSHPEVAGGIVELAESAGVRMLRNEMAKVRGLQIVGLDEFWANRFHPERVLGGLDANRAALVLSHNPDTVDQPGWGAYTGWVLCGHTHGGQCKPPFLPAPLLPVRNRRYQAGEYELAGGRRMYINRGVGHILQVRFNVRPEVTVFSLERSL